LAGRGDKVDLRIWNRSDGALVWVEHPLLVDMVIVGLEYAVGVDPLSGDSDMQHSGSFGDGTGAGAGVGTGDRPGANRSRMDYTSGASEGMRFYPFLPFL
jgi:hypothetical protein